MNLLFDMLYRIQITIKTIGKTPGINSLIDRYWLLRAVESFVVTGEL